LNYFLFVEGGESPMNEDKERKEESQGFKVEDRRHFNPDGTNKEGEREPEPQKQESSQEKEVPSDLPEITFSNLILSLAGSAQMNLGVKKDLKQAKQTIDLLGTLAEKTKGNLAREEDQLLQVILSDLRFRYVEEINKK
jgi:hypothetical protein